MGISNPIRRLRECWFDGDGRRHRADREEQRGCPGEVAAPAPSSGAAVPLIIGPPFVAVFL
jgi:hypothetical protein